MQVSHLFLFSDHLIYLQFYSNLLSFRPLYYLIFALQYCYYWNSLLALSLSGSFHILFIKGNKMVYGILVCCNNSQQNFIAFWDFVSQIWFAVDGNMYIIIKHRNKARFLHGSFRFCAKCSISLIVILIFLTNIVKCIESCCPLFIFLPIVWLRRHDIFFLPITFVSNIFLKFICSRI